MNKNTIELLESFDSNITELYIGFSKITGILDLSKFTRLRILNCRVNKITSIINIPNTLIELHCYDNLLVELNNLQLEFV